MYWWRQKVKAIFRIFFATSIAMYVAGPAAAQNSASLAIGLPAAAIEIHNRVAALLAAGNYSAAFAKATKLEAILKAQTGAYSLAYSVALSDLALVQKVQGKFSEAADLFRRALAIKERTRGPSDPIVVVTLNNLGNVYEAQGKYAEAAELLQRALAIEEDALGPNHPEVARTLNNLAVVNRELSKNVEAAELYQRALAIQEKALGPSHRDVALILENLSDLYDSQGKYSQAEELSRRALAIREKALGPSHPDVANSLLGLAGAFADQGKSDEAVKLFHRALAIQEKVFGPSNLEVAKTHSNLATVYASQSKYAEAADLLRRTLPVEEKVLGPGHPTVALTLGNLANVYDFQGKYAEAAELDQRVLAIEEKAFGPNHPDVINCLGTLANVYADQAKYAEAEELYRRALGIAERVLGPTHPDVAKTHITYRSAGERDLSLDYSRKASGAVIAHARTGDIGSQRPDNTGGLIAQRAGYFVFHVSALASAARARLYPALDMGREGFEIAQWAEQSSAGAAVAQMALRFSSGDSAVAKLVREHQDLAATWHGQDKALIAALSKPEAQQNPAETERLRKEIAETEQKLAANAARLEADFPDYAALANPKPLKVEETQKLLRPEEALVFLLPGHKESYAFALTRDSFDWQTISLGKEAIAEKVSAFRHGLDVNELKKSLEVQNPVFFDLDLAQELYASLLGPADSLIKDKLHLLIVPSGPLTALPFRLLVTQKADSAAKDSSVFGRYRDAAYLLKRQTITILPSVPSLQALRMSARTNEGAKPLIGFADPVFRAEENIAGLKKPGGRIQIASRSTRGYADYWQGVDLDRARLAEVPPLPDTADELREVAKTLGAPLSDLYLGADASETNERRAPLADYRVVYFATHALVAGDVKGLGEPALLLSLPKKPSDFDDGLLTASEVAQLKLNADFVVLSACNTAAGEKPCAEALSGLARAFFYAGARALLVSHWAVDSQAAARLATETFGTLKSDPTIGRAEALRRAMLAFLNDPSEERNPYPAYWAPFFIAGEGAGK
jgi:CHAT domain-containing protein/tetratricopeptide (TPR) repeat protein